MSCESVEISIVDCTPLDLPDGDCFDTVELSLCLVGSSTSGLPTGGDTGQVLGKASDADYDYDWITVAGTGTVTSVGLSASNGIVVTGASPITTAGSFALSVNASDLKTHLSLNNVENTALSTWAGSANLTTVGTISSGTWQGTPIASAYIGAHNQAWSTITATPTTLVGYGITDAQPLDADLSALAALSGTNTIYYRSAANTWTAVTIGSGLSFAAGTLAATGGAGTVTSVGIAGTDGLEVDSGSPVTGSGTITLGVNASNMRTHLSINNVENTALSTWAGSANITTVGTIGSGTWQGTPIASAYIGAHNQAWSTITSTPTTLAGYGISDAQPLDGDLTAIAALSGTNTIYYRSGADTWTAVTVGTGLSFSGGTLANTATGTVTSVAVSGSDGIEIDSGSPITGSGTIALGVNASTLKTHLSLNNVENTALSTWAGSSNLTTLGTIGTGTWQGTIVDAAYLGTGTGITAKFLRGDNTWQTISGGGDALTSNPLSQFAATTSAQLAGVISDETGTGALVFANTPTLVTPVLGTPTSGTLTNCTGYTFANIASKPTTLSGYGITDAQPLDADLTAIAALSGTNTIYYRSAADTWTAVTVGTGLSFTGGTLASTVTGTVTSVAISATDGLQVDSGSPITGSGTITLGVDASTMKTHLSLNNVENTALSTWAGSANITTVGTISSGTWQGTAIASTYIGAHNQAWSTITSTPTTISGYGITDGVVGPSSATDNAVARFDSTTGKLVQNGVVLIDDSGNITGVSTISASSSFTGSGFRILDTGIDHFLQLICGENLTASRNLTIIVNDAARSLTIAGDAAISGTNTGDQDLASYATTAAVAAGYQPLDTTLTAFAALTIAANSLTIGTGADAFSQASFAANTFPARASTGSLEAKSITDFGLGLIDDTDAPTARATLGGTTVGQNVFTLTNPGAITWPRMNADNTVTARTDSETRTDLSLASARTRPLTLGTDGGGTVLTTGTKLFLADCPYAGTIVSATIVSKETGSIVVDIWKANQAIPTVSDSITASAKPTLSSARRSKDSTLTGWTTSISVGDVFAINVDSVTTITQFSIVLEVITS